MAIRIDINSTDVSMNVATCQFTREMNERPTCALELEGVAPEEDDEIVVFAKDGVTPIFGGLITHVDVVGVVPNSSDSVVRVDAVGWERFADWCSVSLSYVSPVSLEDVMEDLVDAALGEYGLTYSPAATSVTLQPFAWDDIPVVEAIRQLRQRTNRVIRVLPDKAIEIAVAGGTPAPVSVTDSTLPKFLLFEVKNQPRERANRVKMRFGPPGTFLTKQQWIANGSDTSWVTDIPATLPPPPLVLIDDGMTPFLATVGTGGMFEWDVTTNAPYGTLSVGTAATPGNGVRIKLGPTIADGDPFETIGFNGLYPFSVIRETGATPKREYREARQDITEYAPAVEIAEATLARVDRASAKLINAETDEDGFDAGQLLSVSISYRGGVSASFLVPSVRVEMVKGDAWRYAFQATEGEEPQRTHQDQWRQLTSGGGSSSTAVSVLPPSSGGSGGGVATGGVSVVPLGGLEMFAVAASDWTDVPGMLPHVAQSSFTGRVRVSLRARVSGGGVTARLWDGTTGVESSEVVSTSMTEVEILAAIVAGERYRLQVKRTAGSGDVYAGPGQLERVS